MLSWYSNGRIHILWLSLMPMLDLRQNEETKNFAWQEIDFKRIPSFAQVVMEFHEIRQYIEFLFWPAPRVLAT